MPDPQTTKEEAIEALVDLMTIIPFAVYPSPGESTKAVSAVAIILSYIKEQP